MVVSKVKCLVQEAQSKVLCIYENTAGQEGLALCTDQPVPWVSLPVLLTVGTDQRPGLSTGDWYSP